MTANGSSQDGSEGSEETTAVEAASSAETTAEQPASASHPEGDNQEPTPQSGALRQQQYYVGLGGALLGGGALMTGVYQRFPDAPLLVPILAGVLATGILVWLVRKSVFPGPDDIGHSEST